MAFESEFEFNQKLKDCATFDRDHIGERFSPQGQHIFLIHKALNAWAETNAPELVLKSDDSEFAASTFGKKTAKLVRKFKTTKRILNYKGEIDEVVGIKTVAALDKELPRRGAAPIDPPETKDTVDVIVKFVGVHGLVGENLFRGDAVFKHDLCNDYEKKHPGRKLVRIGHTTASIDGDAAHIVDRIAKAVKFETGQGTAGKIIIFGSSSGGRATLDLAVRLTRDEIPLEYVAPIDAAFFPNSPQLTNRPKELFGHSDTVPLFSLPAIKAEKKECFFQTLGNFAKSTLHGRQFTSDMAGSEIHGNVTGFTPMKRDEQVKAKVGFRATHDNFHEEIAAVAVPEIQRKIVTILN